MIEVVIIVVCVLLLVAYLFDLSSSRIKIPSVILLLLIGWMTRQLSSWLGAPLLDLDALLQIFGTLGLILIVLEGALELELDESKKRLILRSSLAALVPMLALAFILAGVMRPYTGSAFRAALLCAIPFCVISSAIAIPSSTSLPRADREFVIYESSFSDILGVLFFNFVALHDVVNFQSLWQFVAQLLIIGGISFVATIGLSLLLNKIEHRIKFVPITLMVILVYAIAKIWHLPGLLFIMLFGLFLGNFDELKHVRWIALLHPEKLNSEVRKFRDLTSEATFLMRSLFFILFGYMMETAEILNTATILWAVGITAAIFLLRAAMMKVLRMPLSSVLWLAPRGLITVLLFLSIVPEQRIALVNRSLVIQVVILTALTMMAGMLFGATPRVPASGNEADPAITDHFPAE